MKWIEFQTAILKELQKIIGGEILFVEETFPVLRGKSVTRWCVEARPYNTPSKDYFIPPEANTSACWLWVWGVSDISYGYIQSLNEPDAFEKIADYIKESICQEKNLKMNL